MPEDINYDPVVITLLDGMHSLRITHGALKRLEKFVGMPFDEFIATSEDTNETMVTMAWAGILHENPALTREEMDELVDIRMYAKLRQKVMEAYYGDVSLPEGNANGAGDGASDGIGTMPEQSPQSAESVIENSGA